MTQRSLNQEHQLRDFIIQGTLGCAQVAVRERCDELLYLSLSIRLLPHHTPRRAFVLMLVLPAHQPLLPRALTALPEAACCSTPSNYTPATKCTVLRSKPLLATAPSTNHAVSMLVNVGLGVIVASIAWIHSPATPEPKPAVTVPIVLTGAFVWQGRASRNTKVLLLGTTQRQSSSMV